MSQPLLDLKKLLTSKQYVTGEVTAISGNLVRVATPRGMLEAVGDGLAVGNNVVVRNGRAILVNGQSNAQVYFV